ncbi:MAG: hypothetical protein U9Q03_05375 [Patescibacteria group bacterium]|nr:hypothetical protein [Patescibacteria group bacterium]
MTAEEARRVIAHPEVLGDMLAAMRRHSALRLIHGRFNTLEDKLAMVRDWPGVTDGDIRRALEEGEDRIALFERESPDNPLLDIVVSIYKPTVHETLAYARDRMREAFGKEFWQWDELYADIGPDRVRWLKDVSVPTGGVRIEVVDLGANFDPEDGMVPEKTRGSDSAHSAVIYAAAQDLEWVRQMDGASVPYAIAAGLELRLPGCDRWSRAPFVYRDGDEAYLRARHVRHGYHFTALPSLRGC